jgi:hypothetical protein
MAEFRGSYRARVLAALQSRATDGVVSLSQSELSPLTGASERVIGAHLRRLAERGAIEILPRRFITEQYSYRIVAPERFSDSERWSEARIAMVREHYAGTWNVPLAAMLNALPGATLSPKQVKYWAQNHDLRKDDALLRSRQAPPALGQGGRPITTGTWAMRSQGRHPWATDLIDARIRSCAEAGVSVSDTSSLINKEFGVPVTKGMITRRRRSLGMCVPTSNPIRRAARPEPTEVGRVPAWGSQDAIALLLRDKQRGCSNVAQAARWKIGVGVVERMLGRLARPAVERQAVTPRVAPAPKRHAHVPPRPVGAPKLNSPAVAKESARIADKRRETVTQGVRWTLDGLPKLPPVPHGRCAWPLTCTEPAEGRYCRDHAGMLGRSRMPAAMGAAAE